MLMLMLAITEIKHLREDIAAKETMLVENVQECKKKSEAAKALEQSLRQQLVTANDSIHDLEEQLSKLREDIKTNSTRFEQTKKRLKGTTAR